MTAAPGYVRPTRRGSRRRSAVFALKRKSLYPHGHPRYRLCWEEVGDRDRFPCITCDSNVFSATPPPHPGSNPSANNSFIYHSVKSVDSTSRDLRATDQKHADRTRLRSAVGPTISMPREAVSIDGSVNYSLAGPGPRPAADNLRCRYGQAVTRRT